MRDYWCITIKTIAAQIGRLIRAILEVSVGPLILFLIALALPSLFPNSSTVSEWFDFTQATKWFCIVAAFVLLVYQVHRIYLAKTHDHALILKYQELWDVKAMVKWRSECATNCLATIRQQDWEKSTDATALTNEDAIESILDLFEDIGFYLKGGYLTDEIVHHHFCHYIAIYVPVLLRYVERRRKDEQEPTTWEHVPELYKRMIVVEARKSSWRLKRVVTPIAITKHFNSRLEKYLKQDVLPTAYRLVPTASLRTA